MRFLLIFFLKPMKLVIWGLIQLGLVKSYAHFWDAGGPVQHRVFLHKGLATKRLARLQNRNHLPPLEQHPFSWVGGGCHAVPVIPLFLPEYGLAVQESSVHPDDCFRVRRTRLTDNG